MIESNRKTGRRTHTRRGSAEIWVPLLKTARILMIAFSLILFAFVGTTRADAAVVTYNYGPNVAQTVDVYPSTARRWVLVIHGSWAAGRKISKNRSSLKLQARGFRVFNVDYRKTTDYPGLPGAAWPAQRDDVLAAIAWVKARASQFGIDPNRGGVYGFSAGGHLAAQAGLFGNGGARVKAIVSASGVLQPHRVQEVADSDPRVGIAGDFPTIENKTLARWEAVALRCPMVDWTDCSKRWTDFKPETHISADDPPMLMFQGTADPSVPSQSARSFQYWLRRKGVPNILTQCVNWSHTEACAFDGGTREKQLLDFLWLKTA